MNGSAAGLCMDVSVAYREPSCRRTPRDAMLENTCMRRAQHFCEAAWSDRMFRHATPQHGPHCTDDFACEAPQGAKWQNCRSGPTAPQRARLQYSSPRMKSESLSLAAMRASRLLSCAALAASLAVLIGQVSSLTWLMSPPAALCGVLLALAALAVSARPRWAHAVGQALALLSCVIAFGPVLAERFGASSSALPPDTRALLERILPGGNNMAGATGIM